MSGYKLSEDWILQNHSRTEIAVWVNALQYSYFFRAWGGHANDGDQFALSLTFVDEDALRAILNTLRLSLPEAALGWIKVHTIPCYCEIFNGQITFSFSGADGNTYEVTDTDFNNCRKFEALIEINNLQGKVSRECESRSTCISKSNYPHIFTF